MSRTAKPKTVVTPKPTEVATPTPVSVPATKKTTTRKVKTESVASVSTAPVSTAPVSTETAPRSVRVRPTRESIEVEFDELIKSVADEINSLHMLATKTKGVKGVKFLRSVNKRLRVLKRNSLNVAKSTRKNQGTKRNNSNSIFLKPVQLSGELAKFTKWDVNVPRSRVDVTRFICNYIKEKNLQLPENRRLIRVSEDKDFASLLKYESREPVQYCHIQRYLKPHYKDLAKTEAVSSAPVSTAPSTPAKHASVGRKN